MENLEKTVPRTAATVARRLPVAMTTAGVRAAVLMASKAIFVKQVSLPSLPRSYLYLRRYRIIYYEAIKYMREANAQDSRHTC